MITPSPISNPQASFFDVLNQVDSNHPLIQLSHKINWSKFEEELSQYYSPNKGRGSKPIRLMTGLLILKQMYNFSDETVIDFWMLSHYFQVFCGEREVQLERPCHSTELVKFRQRIGESGVALIFSESIDIHGSLALEDTVLVDTTVQEKNITYPTDHKLAIKIINRLNKLAKKEGVVQRRTYVKEVRSLRLASRMFKHVKRRKKATRALKRLRTIANILLRELKRKLPADVLEREANNFAMYEKVLKQKRNDKNKIYSLHEPDSYCVGKGKDHKPYEYGAKASVVATKTHKIITAVKSHDEHVHDSKTLSDVLELAQLNAGIEIATVVVDRGYRGSINSVDSEVILPSAPLKRDSEKERQRKRKLCQTRSAIEPVIGHLKSDFGLLRCKLKGNTGNSINLMLAASAWNFRKWMTIFFVLKKLVKICQFLGILFKFGKSWSLNFG